MVFRRDQLVVPKSPNAIEFFFIIVIFFFCSVILLHNHFCELRLRFLHTAQDNKLNTVQNIEIRCLMRNLGGVFYANIYILFIVDAIMFF